MSRKTGGFSFSKRDEDTKYPSLKIFVKDKFEDVKKKLA